MAAADLETDEADGDLCSGGPACTRSEAEWCVAAGRRALRADTVLVLMTCPPSPGTLTFSGGTVPAAIPDWHGRQGEEASFQRILKPIWLEVFQQ